MNKNNLASLKKTLKLNYSILGIHYLDKFPKKYNHYKDTACTALIRAFLKKETLFFDAKKYPQLCMGANYFLNLSKIKDSEAIKIYTKKEHIFQSANTCKEFIKSLPKFPKRFQNKFIVIKPFEARDTPRVIILLVNPAQAGRIIGLANYNKYKKINIIPNQPTCLSFFAPIATKSICINFIDYYDRYYQGKINGKYLWPENKMIVSLEFRRFKEILKNFSKSPQGNLKQIDIDPKKIDRI